MSYDPNADQSPIAHFEQPKSKKKWWLLGGLGCAAFLLICCGGSGLIGYLYLAKPLQDLIRESQEFARTSEVVADAVGEPVAVADQPKTMFPNSSVENGVSMQEIRFEVTGSRNKGELVLIIAQRQLNFERESLTLELDDGTVIDLDPEEELNLDIDDGSNE